jgi:signal transduction histidine kinase
VLLSFFLPAFLILSALAALLPGANDRAAEVLAGERNHEIAALLAEQLSRDLIGYVDILDRVGSRPEIYGFEPAAQKLALRAFVGQLRPFDAGVVVVNDDGVVVATDARALSAESADWSERPFARRALSGGLPAVVSDIAQFPFGEAVVLAVPIRAPSLGERGFIAGMFRVDSNATNGLREVLAGLPAGEGRRLVVLDSETRVVYGDSLSLSGTVLRRYAASLSDRGRGRRVATGGSDFLLAAAQVPETGWLLAIEEPWSGLVSAYRGATRLVLGLLLLGIVAPVLVAAAGIDRITRPVCALTAAVRQAASGRLGERVEVRTGDELESLADQFNEMSARLAASYAELEQRVAERTAELNRLYEQAKETATLAERNRLARDLHDSVTQTIFSAKLTADVLPKLWERDPALAQAKLEELRWLTGGALAEMRSLLVELRPAALVEADLAELLQNLAGAAQARTTARIVVCAQKGVRLPPGVQEAFYRIAQEALNNALKHARADTIRITLARDENFAQLVVTDDGIGFEAEAVGTGNHFGLGILRERAAAAGATLRIEARRGRGSQLMLSWPASNV